MIKIVLIRIVIVYLLMSRPVCHGKDNDSLMFLSDSSVGKITHCLIQNQKCFDSLVRLDSTDYDLLFSSHIKNPRMLNRYNDFLQKALFEYEDEGKKCSKFRLNRWRRRLPEAIAPYVLLIKYYFQDTTCKAYKECAFAAEVISKNILESGGGNYDTPFQVLSFYESYYFVYFNNNFKARKAGAFLSDDNRYLGAVEVYIEKKDELIFVYFEFTHLLDFALASIPDE